MVHCSLHTSFFEVEEDKEDKEDKEEEEENDDEDIIIIIIEAAAVALQKVLDEIVFSCHRRVDSFDVFSVAPSYAQQQEQKQRAITTTRGVVSK